MHSLGLRKGRPGAWLCCPLSHQALTGSEVQMHELMAVMVSPERGPTHLPSPSAEITSRDIPCSIWDVLLLTQAQLLLPLVAPPSIRCLCPCSAGSTRAGSVWPLPAPTESWHWLKGPCQPGRWVQQPWEGTVLLVTHPCRQCREMGAVSLHMSPISAALPVAVQHLFHCQPLLVQHAEGISHL